MNFLSSILTCVLFFLFADTMADFAADLSKIVSEKKLIGKAVKVPKKRKLPNRGIHLYSSISIL
jgi:hypothetical protein